MNSSSDKKKQIMTVKNLTQPILVRWSNRYLGKPPLIKISKAINISSFMAIITEPLVTISKNSLLAIQDIFCILATRLSKW